MYQANREEEGVAACCCLLSFGVVPRKKTALTDGYLGFLPVFFTIQNSNVTDHKKNIIGRIPKKQKVKNLESYNVAY